MLAPPASPAAAAATWRDPVAYCRAVGSIDRPDRRYIGPKAFPWMRRPFLADGDTSHPGDAPLPIAWRCMDGQVKACSYGANLPCDSKADTRRTNRGATAWCRENPGSDSIPMAATGHATVYDWSCNGRRAVAGKPLVAVDARGYQADIWRTVSPQAQPSAPGAPPTR